MHADTGWLLPELQTIFWADPGPFRSIRLLLPLLLPAADLSAPPPGSKKLFHELCLELFTSGDKRSRNSPPQTCFAPCSLTQVSRCCLGTFYRPPAPSEIFAFIINLQVIFRYLITATTMTSSWIYPSNITKAVRHSVTCEQLVADNPNNQREQEDVSFSQAVIDGVYYTNDYLHHSLCCNMLVLGVCVFML